MINRRMQLDTLDVVGKIVFSLAAFYYAYDLFYIDIYLKKTKEFSIPGIGTGSAGKIENDFIRRLLKFIMMLIFIWLTFNTP